ncbi:MAG: glycosyltransferase [Armatimonadota bacterium]|jgi:glycosyltransferase involved in cell wall biosynthesis
MRVNVVTGGPVDWVFADLVDRLKQIVAATDIVVTERPLDQADVLHFWRPQAAVGVPDLSRAVLTCHGFGCWGTGRPIYGEGVIHAFRRAAGAIVLNTADAERLQWQGIEPERVHCIPHAVDSDVFALRPEHDPAQRLVIGRVGRPYGRLDDPVRGVECKGRATLDEIMRGLRHRAPEVKWLLLGAGWEHEERLARDLGYAVEFAAREDVGYPRGHVAAYHRMDVYLVTSRAEGGPASLPEAMACGVWPLCTPVGMCTDLICPGLSGELYPVNGHGAAIGQIEALLDSRGRLEHEREAVRASVLSMTWRRWAEAHQAVYESVA